MTTHIQKIQALGNRMATNLTAMGVSASFGDGGLTLADKILQIQHFTDGLLLYADKSIIQINDTANFYALLLKDGYPQSNEEIKFFVESNSPTLRTLTADTDNIVSPRYSFASMPTFSDSSETVYLDADHSISLRKFGSNQVQLCGAVGTTCQVNVTSISLNNNVLTYTSNGGTTTVDVSDKDMSVIYSDVEGVTINDYYSVYTANTGSDGVATVSYVGKGAGLLNIQCFDSERILSSKTYSILDCTFLDKGLSTDYNDTGWVNSGLVSPLDRTDGTKIEQVDTSSGGFRYRTVSPATDICIEFDFKVFNASDSIFSFRNSSTLVKLVYASAVSAEANTWTHIKVTVKNGKYYVNTSTKGTALSEWNRFTFQSYEGHSLKYKNFEIYPI